VKLIFGDILRPIKHVDVCKSLIKITKEEFALKWGMEKRK